MYFTFLDIFGSWYISLSMFCEAKSTTYYNYCLTLSLRLHNVHIQVVKSVPCFENCVTSVMINQVITFFFFLHNVKNHHAWKQSKFKLSFFKSKITCLICERNIQNTCDHKEKIEIITGKIKMRASYFM